MWDPRNTLELAGTAPPLRSFVQLALHQHGLLESDVPESDLFPVLTEQWHHQNCLQRQIPCDKPFSGTGAVAKKSSPNTSSMGFS